MISATRRWLRRNRTNFAIGLGVLGAGYVAGQYVLSKISEARDRMSSDRTARENLRRRFQQNQEDCTFTVLALLPTAAENILEALPVENITHELQQQKAERLNRSAAPSELSSGAPSVTDDNGKSVSSLQTEDYVHASQMATSNSDNGDAGSQRSRKSKAQLWSELKISAITRTFTLLYTLSLLTLLTRIQLNLLGRRNYLSSVVSLASHPPHESTISLENHDDDNVDQSYGNDFETNRKFLTFSWWLLHRGWREIMEKVELAVKGAFGPLNPKEDVTLEKLSNLTLEVRKKVEGATEEDRRTSKWLSYLLPPRDQEDFVLQESGMSLNTPPSASSPSEDPLFSPDSSPIPAHSALRRLLDETSDLVDSPTFTHILTLLLDTTFSHLTDNKLSHQAFKIPLPPLSDPTPMDPSLRVQEILDPTTTASASSTAQYTDEQEIPDPAQAKAKLATILAVITRQAHAIGNGVPNEYVQAMEGVRELEAFAAVVYSSNFEFEAFENGRNTGADAAGRSGSGSGSSGKGAEAETIPDENIDKAGTAKMVTGDGAGNGGFVAATTGMFESVWCKVTGRAQQPLTG